MINIRCVFFSVSAIIQTHSPVNGANQIDNYLYNEMYNFFFVSTNQQSLMCVLYLLFKHIEIDWEAKQIQRIINSSNNFCNHRYLDQLYCVH